MKKDLSSEKNLWTQHEVKLQTAQAVFYMHQEGYCHRDLKPENFLVSSFKDGSVLIQLTDLAESKRSSEEKSDGEPVHTTWWYQAPEVKSGEKISHPASDTFSLGVIFCEIERTTEPNDIENDIVPVAYFSHLAQDMMQHDFRIRPDMLTVLQRLGMSAELLCISGKPWKNAFVDEQDVMSDDNNIGHHRILALLLSDKSDHVETAYWLLNEIAMQEASSSSFRVQSVLLILPYFHANIRANVNNNDDRSTFTKLLYCQALQALCQRPYFVLSDEMRLNLQAFSIIPACERSVVVVVARVAERFPSVLLSCEVDGVWGKLGDTFEWFAYGFVNDWSNLEVATAARNMFPVAQAPLPDQIASG
jgi:serine/threonine protein kinase